MLAIWRGSILFARFYVRGLNISCLCLSLIRIVRARSCKIVFDKNTVAECNSSSIPGSILVCPLASLVSRTVPNVVCSLNFPITSNYTAAVFVWRFDFGVLLEGKDANLRCLHLDIPV